MNASSASVLPGGGAPRPVVTALAVGYLAGYAAAGGAARITVVEAASVLLAWFLARRR